MYLKSKNVNRKLGHVASLRLPFSNKKSETLNYMKQMQLNFLAALVNTALKQHSNISLFGKFFGMVTLFIHDDAKIDVAVSKFISILPVIHWYNWRSS